MFIKKIFENKIDESVHKQFVRFGKGTYLGRAVTKITKQPEKIKVGTSYELATEMVEFCANLAQNLKCSGIILAKEKLPELDKYDAKKKTRMVQYDLNDTMDSNVIKKVLQNPLTYCLLLDIEGPGILMKSKKKLPKPGKSGDLKIDDKFCQLELDKKYWPQIKNEFCFDMPEFKKALAVHTFFITDILIPKGEKDFEKLRILSKRKGKIQRKLTIDKKDVIKEKDLEA